MSDYYDRAGSPITMEEWAGSFGDNTVALTELDDVTVSTVWLGLNHNFGDGPPLIFETMIFGGQHDEFQERYSTEAEALAGHEIAVTMARLEVAS